MRSGDAKTRKEATWAVTNYSSGATSSQLQFLAENHAIHPLIIMLGSKSLDAKLLQLCLDCLSNILKAGELEDGSNPCVTYTEECGGLDVIEKLQEHENHEVYTKALKIIERYFSTNDEEVAETEDVTTFDFTAQQNHQQAAFSF